ncbi:MAG: HNH endonuclease domain-containing protein [Chitinophagales bacterium]
MTLPESKELPVNLLAACFNKTSATYKFYWLLSILQAAERGKLKIAKRELFSRMISNAWFTVNYFNVSFGKQDLIQDAIRSINRFESISIDEKRERVFQKLLSARNSNTEKLLWHFNKNVPHWFLSPWFPKIGNETYSAREKRIYNESQQFDSKCLYGLYQDFIEINPEWLHYMNCNSKVLKDFCFWNLTLFLQSKNPNVPDIPNKLIKPAKRSGLNKQRTLFWDMVLDELGYVNCIYTGKKLTKGNYAVEHFIPYSFVSHDLIWNLIPADKSFNNSKSNKLPVLERYFEPYYSLQKNAYDIVKKKSPKNKLLEDYLTVFNNYEDHLSEIKLREVIQPLITIASNNGFEFMK